jgi:hypothetical protein
MGADQGGKEEGLAPFYGGRKRDSHLGRVIRFSAWWRTKKPAHGRFDNTEYSSSSCTDDYGVSPKSTALFSAD